MAKEIQLMVTSPYHGADGMIVLYQPGDRFPLGTDLPPDLLVTDVIVDTAEKPPGESTTGRIEDVGGPADPETGGRPVQADRQGDTPPGQDSPAKAEASSPPAEAAKPSPPPGRASTSRGTRSSGS